MGWCQNIVKLTRGEFVHEMLADDCRKLGMGADFQICPEGIPVVPLWEGHSSVTGYCQSDNPERRRFIRYEFEYPEEYVLLGYNIHAVITQLLVWYWTESEAEDEELRKIACLMEYPYIDRLLAEIEEANQEEAESQDVWEERFRLSLP
jgi:hypothetical protein